MRYFSSLRDWALVQGESPSTKKDMSRVWGWESAGGYQSPLPNPAKIQTFVHSVQPFITKLKWRNLFKDRTDFYQWKKWGRVASDGLIMWMHQWKTVVWFKSCGTKRGWGKPKITLIEVANKDMLINEVTKSMILDGIE